MSKISCKEVLRYETTEATARRSRNQKNIYLAETSENAEKNHKLLNNFIDFFLSVLRDLCENHFFS